MNSHYQAWDCVLLETIRSSRKVLANAGFSAVFVDENWVASHCSPVEAHEWVEYRQAYEVEAIYSESPTSIVYSEPGDYPWVTKYFSAATAERQQKYGSLDRIFNDPGTRHLAELCVGMQRFSRMLERATDADRRASELRLELISGALKADIALARALQRPGRSAEQCVFSRGEDSLSFTPVHEEYVDYQRFLCRVELSCGLSVRRVWLERALPNFELYCVYRDVDQFLLSRTAWDIVLTTAINTAEKAGWDVS